CAIAGRVRDVIYLGLNTRYLIEIEGGKDLTVIEQNLTTTSMEVLAARGRAVLCVWDASHNRPLAASA
ncbi:MAG: TOBE domain-containing protein, partial [Anaerolineae bacterium]